MDVSEPVRAIPPYGGSRPGRLKSAAHPWVVTSAAWGYRSKEGTPDGMKLLLLTCHTGEGHNSAAQALSEAAQDLGIQAQIADPLVFGNQRAGRMAASCYNTIIRRTPRLFGAIYKAGDLYSATRLTSPVYWANSLYANGLSAYLREGGFDAVACTHLYGMEAMTALGKRGAWTAPCFGILTDYTCVPFFAETCLDGYFIPHADLLPEMVQKGVPAERIRCTGIPVSPQFDAAVDRAAARRQVGMPQDTRAYLLMSGGMGCSYVLDLCEELRRCAPAGFTAYVLAGRNARLMEELRRRYGDDARIQPVGFTRQVALYMRAADVLLSKPGGLSSTEAAAANVPLVHIMAIPGCETRNAAFFSSRGMSVRAANAREAVQAAGMLVENPEAAERMRRMQRQYVPPRAAERILLDIAAYCGAPCGLPDAPCGLPDAPPRAQSV